MSSHTHFGTGDRVRVVFDGRYDLSPGALVRASASGYHFLVETSLTILGRVQRPFSVAHNFAGGQNIQQQAKTVFCDKSDARF